MLKIQYQCVMSRLLKRLPKLCGDTELSPETLAQFVVRKSLTPEILIKLQNWFHAHKSGVEDVPYGLVLCGPPGCG